MARYKVDPWERVIKYSHRTFLGCWLWDADKCWYPSGYPRLWDGYRYVCAHRYVYERLIGPVPAELDIDHLCRTPRCINPMHLEPVTRQVNILRGVSPSAKQAKQTHCKYGHPFDEANTIRRVNGGRRCRACGADATRRYLDRKRALVVSGDSR